MVEVQIERIGGQGDGVGRHEAGAIFVPLTLPGEQVRAGAAGDRGRLLSIVTSSADRIEPPCPHFGQCGGCALQHWRTQPYLAWKSEQIGSALVREGLDVTLGAAFQALPGERRRVSLHARKTAGGVVLGFKSRRSWSVVEIDACTVADRRLVAVLPSLSRLAEPLMEHPKSAPILHVTLTETGVAVEVSGVEAKGGGLSADARVRAASIAAEVDLARVTLAGDMIYQSRPPIVRLGEASVVLPPGGFLQAVARAEAAMARIATDALDSCDRVADLFCGSGAFTFRLAQRASVLALDGSRDAIEALQGGRASVRNFKTIEARTRDLFRRPLLAGEMKGLQGVVLDPPRAGALDQAVELARSSVATVVSVSCNPTTFARDAAVLVSGGFTLEAATPVDQFLWSPHMEVVGVFRR